MRTLFAELQQIVRNLWEERIQRNKKIKTSFQVGELWKESAAGWLCTYADTNDASPSLTGLKGFHNSWLTAGGGLKDQANHKRVCVGGEIQLVLLHIFCFFFILAASKNIINNNNNINCHSSKQAASSINSVFKLNKKA